MVEMLSTRFWFVYLSAARFVSVVLNVTCKASKTHPGTMSVDLLSSFTEPVRRLSNHTKTESTPLLAYLEVVLKRNSSASIFAPKFL